MEGRHDDVSDPFHSAPRFVTCVTYVRI